MGKAPVNGGPAFAALATSPMGDVFEQPGIMSLRAYYAGQALAGLCANPGGPFQKNCSNGWDIVNCDASHVARWCVELADAMLDEMLPTPPDSQGGEG